MSRRKQMATFLAGIDKLIEEKKFIKAEMFLKKYIEANEEQHYAVISKLGRILVKNGKFEEAIEVLQPLLYTNGVYRERAIYTLAYAYADLGNYEKSLEYVQVYMKNPSNNRKDSLVTLKQLKADIEGYLKFEIDRKKLGLPTDFHYSESAVLEHIINEHSFNNHGEDKSYFSEKIDIYSLFYMIKEELNSRNDLKYIPEVSVRNYCFNYDLIGYVRDNKMCNVLSVITDSYLNIITMFPTDYEIYNDYINELNKEKKRVEEKQKVIVRKSQIEKFNQRYGRIV